MSEKEKFLYEIRMIVESELELTDDTASKLIDGITNIVEEDKTLLVGILGFKPYNENENNNLVEEAKKIPGIHIPGTKH